MKLFFGGVILTPKRSLKNAFSGVQITPDIEELKWPPKRSYPVPKIFTPLSELKVPKKSKNNPFFGIIFTPEWELKELFFKSKNDPKFGVKLRVKVTP